MDSVGQLIQNKRNQQKCSLRKLASAVSISSTEMMKIEKGERENPPAKTLKAIADYLGINQVKIMIVAGYLDPESLPADMQIHGIGLLSQENKRHLQVYVDFLISRQEENNGV